MNGLGVNPWRLQCATEHTLRWLSAAVSEDLKADGVLVPWAGGMAALCYYVCFCCMFVTVPPHPALAVSGQLPASRFQQLR